MYSQTKKTIFGLVLAGLSLPAWWSPVADAETGAVQRIPMPPEPSSGQWLPCAVEGGRCNVLGLTTVRYGDGGSWVYGEATSPFACSNSIFGDPKVGTKKICYFHAAPTTAWTRCAVEGGRCNLLEAQFVRYGVEGAWLYGSFGGTTSCTNAIFGDPKVGTRKECYVSTPFPQGGWARCAIEGGRCNFVGRAAVRYGAGDAWVYGTTKDGIACTNASFSDPVVGTQKECYFRP